MISSSASSRGERPSLNPLLALFCAILLASVLYFSRAPEAPPLLVAATSLLNGSDFSYQVIHQDLEVDWSGDGDFDPKDKCPEDFFEAGFTLICKQQKRGESFKFLYHPLKKLLYRIDEDLVDNQTRIGLHWVKSTSFNAKYRIADTTFKGGKSVQVPAPSGTTRPQVFEYGEAVSKKRVQRERELFLETHIQPKQCEEWWDIFNFVPE